MPFTPSHAAAVLPFLRMGVGGAALPASALIFGSIAPDVPYYLWMPFGEPSTHTISGAVGVDVLLAALVWLLWHGLVAAPALAGLPPADHARLRSVPVGLRPRLRGARDVVSLYLAFALGALTHVVWDSFTHPHRWGTNRIDVLNEVYLERPVSHWLQLASTGIGLLVLGLYGRALWRALPRSATDLSPLGVGAIAGWLSIGGAAVVGAVLGAVDYAGGGTGHGLTYVMTTRCVSTAAFVALVVCAIWHLSPRLSGRARRAASWGAVPPHQRHR